MIRVFDDGKIFGETGGTGRPKLIGLHGWGRTQADISPLLVAASEGAGWLSVDLPGFGASPVPDVAEGAIGYSKMLAHAIAHDIDPSGAIFVGHSFGGAVSVCFAAAHPELVRGLVLVGSRGLTPRSAPTNAPSAVYKLLRWANHRGLVSDTRMEAARQKRGSRDYRAAQGVMRDVLVKTVNEDCSVELAQVKCPVALVWGVDDSEVPVTRAREAFAGLQARGVVSQLTEIQGAAHFVHVSQPEAVLAAIRFVNESAGGSTS